MAMAEYRHIRWTVSDLNTIPPQVLIDHPKFWELRSSELGSFKEKISKSERLSSLINEPRNKIVSLPDPKSVVRHFYCSYCGCIPFPWATDPEKQQVDEGVYLCKNGHAFCRTCYRLTRHCVFTVHDYVEVFGDNKPTKELIKRHTKSVKNALGNWGTIRMCSDPQGNPRCGLLSDMISFAEFACKYYYNWCDFRGRGVHLWNHQEKCLKADSTGIIGTAKELVTSLAIQKSRHALSEVSEESYYSDQEKLEKADLEGMNDESDYSEEEKNAEEDNLSSHEEAIFNFDISKTQAKVQFKNDTLLDEYGGKK